MIKRKAQWFIFLGINAGLLLLFGLFPLYEKLVMPLPQNKCMSVKFLGLYCIGCGGTRAFQSLTDFDILGSIKYNPIVVVGALLFIAYYCYMVFYLFKRTPRKPFFSLKVFWVIMGCWFAYFLIRNGLLFFGVDILGDIIMAGAEPTALIQKIGVF